MRQPVVSRERRDTICGLARSGGSVSFVKDEQRRAAGVAVGRVRGDAAVGEERVALLPERPAGAAQPKAAQE
eukprot:156191-Pleurochrysis_carterae.AAC.1